MARIFSARDRRFGGYLEDYEPGDIYRHWPGKTITEAEDHMFCLLTLAASPLHVDRAYAAKETEFGRNIVVGTFIYSLLLGMSVPDISGRAIANLGRERAQASGADVPWRHALRQHRGAERPALGLAAGAGDPDGAHRRLQPGRGEALQLHPLGPAALPAGGESLMPKRRRDRSPAFAWSSWRPWSPAPARANISPTSARRSSRSRRRAAIPTRRMGWTGPGEADSYFWKLLNRNKLSITLDLKSDAGPGSLRALLAEADVLIENMRPGKLEALGFGCDDLLRANPSWSSCG